MVSSFLLIFEFMGHWNWTLKFDLSCFSSVQRSLMVIIKCRKSRIKITSATN